MRYADASQGSGTPGEDSPRAATAWHPPNATRTGTLSDYVLGARLHHSATSIVYEASSASADAAASGRRDPVCVKRLPTAHPSSDDIQRLEAEFDLGRAAHAACPEGVVEYLALVDDGDGVAIVTRRVEGEDLGRKVASAPLEAVAAVRIASRLATTLHALHEARITHGDLKPGNVVMQGDHPVLADFDAAARLSRRNERVEWSATPRGTLAYSAPEQTGRTNRVVDARADLYSLGVTLFQLLTGRLPFESEDALALVHALLATPPPRADALVPGLPDALSDVVARALAKDPEERYQSAAGFAFDLDRIAEALTAGRSLSGFAPGQQDRPARLSVPQRLYGRGGVLGHLLGEVRHAARGGSSVSWVSGHAGIGKSALINELEPHVAARGGQFARGRFELLQRDTPMLAFATALSALVRARELGEGPSATAALATALAQRLGHEADALADLVPSLALRATAQVGTPAPALVEERQVLRGRRLVAVSTLLELLAAERRPIVIAVDDLQWADDASLDLLADLCRARPPAGVVLLGAFRPLEAAHPLTTLVGGSATGLSDKDRVARFELSSLRSEDVHELLGDTVPLRPDDLHTLAEACLAGSGGNPFHLHALLVDIYESGALAPPAGADDAWQLDAHKLDAVLRDSPEGVVEFMMAKLADLPEPSRALVEAAACVGARQTRRALCDALACHDAALDEALAPVLNAGYLRRSVRDREGYRFLHDRVQQAAWERCGEARRVTLHFRLGCAGLLAAPQPSGHPSSARLAEVAGHLAYAINADLAVLETCTPEQRAATVDALQAAADRALTCAAFDRAEQLTRASRRVLESHGDPFGCDPERTTRALLQAARAAAGLSDLDTLEALLQQGEAAGLDARVLEPVYAGWIGAMFARGDVAQTFAAATSVLRRHGVHIPPEPKMHHALARLAQLRLSMWRGLPKGIEDLREEPDPDALLAVRMLRIVQECAYRVSEAAAILCLAETAIRARSCGHTPEAGFAWAMASLIWVEAFDDVEGAHQLGRWAHLLIDEEAHPALKVDGLFGWTALVRPWVEPLHDTVDDLRRIWRLALRGGDARQIESVPSGVVFTRLFIGDPLHEVQRETWDFIEVEERYGHPVPDMYALAQYLACLRGEAEDPARLSGTAFDIDSALPHIADETSRASVALMALMLAVIHNDPAAAERALVVARAERRGHRHIFTRALWPYYGALARLMTIPKGGWARAAALREVEQLLRQLRGLRGSAPSNVDHRIAHVRGLLARTRGHQDEAQRLLTHAAELAREHGWPHEAALIHEALAELYETAGDLAARNGHAREALFLVRRWEGTVKLAMLEARWPRLEVERSSYGGHASESQDFALDVTSSGFRATARLDSASVTRAARALSGEIDLDSLVMRLVELAAENAGATRATLVRLRDGEPWFEATVASAPDGTRNVERIGHRASEWAGAQQVCPAALLAESMLLRRPQVHGDLRREDDLSDGLTAARERGARSLMRVPLLRNDEPVGVLILENDLAADTFSTDRVRVLEVLAAQAAISIDNAELYAQLRESLDTQVALTQANSRFVPQEFIASLGHTSIAAVELGDSVEREMAVLFSDVRGFATLIEGMPAQETIGFINEYLSAMEPAVTAHQGFVDSYIGDAIMALFAGGGGDAVGAAVDMLRRLHAFNERRRARGHVAIQIGIGVHSGPLTMGTIGGAQRIKCGVIGDAVNLASRIETATKQYGVALLASGSAVTQLDDEARRFTREVDHVRVVGRERPVVLHEVFAGDEPELRQAKLDAAATWAGALAAYRRRQFREARSAFGDVLAKLPSDPVAEQWRARCADLVRTPPPDDWDPVFTLAEK